jgi:diguanylate cyclase (GGDEF)-like protein
MPVARKVDLRKLFQPSDTIAFIVIALGLFIALFLDEMAVRLIGVCIAILGGVALFMMISPRIADLSIEQSKRRTVSQPTNIAGDTRKDETGTRITFEGDAFRTEFGGDSEDSAAVDERQGVLFDDLPVPKPARPSPSQATPPALIGTHIGDGGDGVTIVGVRPRKPTAEPKLVIDHRTRRSTDVQASAPEPEPPKRAQRPARATDEPRTVARTVRSADASTSTFATGVDKPIDLSSIDGDIALDDDVIIRKKAPATETPSTPVVPPAEGQNRTEPLLPDTPAVVEEPVLVAQEPAEGVPGPLSEETGDHAQQGSVQADVSARHSGDVFPTLPSAEDAPKARSLAHTVSIPDLIDGPDAFDASEPRKEFDYLLNRVLQVIRSMVNARTASFLLVSSDQGKLIVEQTITDVGDGVFTTERKLPIGDDVVSQIALHGRPEILTEIRATAELDLLPYYQRAAGTQSFIGVPVYYGKNVVGVLCADAKEPDAYDSFTIGFFGHFTKLISSLIQSYTAKYDLQHSARVLQAIELLRNYVRERGIEQQSVVRALLRSAIESVDVVTIGLVLFDADKGWSIVKAASGDYPEYGSLIGQPVDLDASAIGSAITGGRTVELVGSPGVLRVVHGEPDLGDGQFVAIPITSFTGVYGALYIENPSPSVSQQDVAVLESIAHHAGTFFEHVRAQEQVTQGALLDEVTGVMNRAAFEQRIQEEHARAIDFQMPLTLCMLRVDPAGSSSDTALVERIIGNVLSKLRHELRPFDVIGRIDTDLLAIVVVSSRAQSTQIWAERMRKDIASSIMEFEGRRFSATVSMGIAEFDAAEPWDRLLDNAYQALTMSSRHGNKVTVFA